VKKERKKEILSYTKEEFACDLFSFS